MTVLILKNIASEGPGTIEGFLKERALPCRVVELGEGEPVPPLDEFHAMVVMGGPMAIYEADRHPFLKEGFKAIEEAFKRDIGVLGICLGAQAIAHALGARVFNGHSQEVGWLDIELTAEGLKDKIMAALSPGLKVFHWHGDTFDLPKGAVRLARSGLYENQAFRYGSGIYALQFHIEVTPEMVARWFRGDPGEARIIEDTARFHEDCRRKALGFYSGFFENSAGSEGGGKEKHFN